MRRNKKGFTLVEVMVSVALLAIITAGIVSSIIFSRQFVDSAYDLEIESAKAQKIIDALILEIPGHDPLVEVQRLNQVVVADMTAYYTPWNTSFVYNPSQPYQYMYIKRDTLTGHGINGYEIKVAVFYNGGKNQVVTSAFTDEGWEVE